MRKIFLLFAMAGTVAFTGCTVEDDQPDVIENNYTFVAEAFDLNTINLGFESATGRYEYLVDFNEMLYPSDVILVYRRVTDNGVAAWQQIPRTLYIGGTDEVDYDFNFTREDLLIFADANFDLATAPEFTVNQTFRVVIIPADASARMDYSNYETVAAKFNIKESDVKIINGDPIIY
jgi:hypothetical protein